MSANQGAIVRKQLVRMTDSITRPSNTTTYAANDVISEVTTNDHYSFTAPNQLTRSGEIVHASIVSNDAVATSLDGELYLFYADIAEVADNAALALTDAEMLTCIGVIDFATANWKDGKAGAGGTSRCDVSGLSIPYSINDVSSDYVIYGQLVAANAYVPVSAEVFTVTLTARVD